MRLRKKCLPRCAVARNSRMFNLKSKKLLSLAIIFLLLVFGLGYYLIVDNHYSGLRVYFLDVGQGDATLIRTPGKNNILIDGGPNSAVLSQLARRLPWTERKIDLVILTHPHSDHLEGLNQVLQRYEVGQILMTGVVSNTPVYEEWLNLIQTKKIPVKIVDQPQQIAVDEVVLDMLYPRTSLLHQEVKNLNNSSIVLRVKYQGVSILFMGDAETAVENELLAAHADLVALILKIGHHGSKNATGETFLQAVYPQVAIISVGADNSFGHPSLRTIKRLERERVEVLRTDQGTVLLTVDPAGKFSFDIL